jgi:hypothetical protein
MPAESLGARWAGAWLCAAALLCAAPAAARAWSPPAALAPCASAGAPQVLFPSDSPSHATGAGAIVWPAGASCAGGAGARLDVLRPGAAPAAPVQPRPPGVDPRAPLAAAAAPGGRIAILGADPRHPGQGLALEGSAGGAFGALPGAATTAPAAALATAYLGDLALLTSREGLLLQVQRWFGGAAGAPRSVLAPARSPGSPTVAMDYRSDVLAAWTAGGGVWARAMPASGRILPAQRLGPAGARTRIAALLSDDNRAIVIWSTERAGATDVYFDQSATGPQFAHASRIEHAPGLAASESAPQLVRLSSESVVCAWVGASEGRSVLRTAPVDQHGLRAVATIAAPAGGDLLLDALAPGPRGEAAVLASEPVAGSAGTAAPGQATLLAARGIDAAPGRTLFGPLQPVAAPGPVSGATVAVEPGTDRAIVAWRGAAGTIEYSLQPGAQG